MENYLSLRSLEATGRPSGTGRSTSTASSPARDDRFADALHESDARAARSEERRQATQRSQDRRNERASSRDDVERRQRAHRRDRNGAARRNGPTANDDGAEVEGAGSDPAKSAREKVDAQNDASAKKDAAQHAEQPTQDERKATEARAAKLDAAQAPSSTTASAQASDAEEQHALSAALMNKSLEQHATAHVTLAQATLPAVAESAELPVAATGEAHPLEIANPRPGENAERKTLGPDEAHATKPNGAAELQTQIDANHARFEVRDAAAAKSEVAPSKTAPAPRPAADVHAPEILRQIRLSVTPATRQANLQLEPEHLGRIAIKLAVEHGKLRAQVRAEKSETLAVLQHHAPELRALLETRGVTPEHVEFQLGLERGKGEHPTGDQRGAQSSNDERTTAPSILTRASRELRALVRGAWGIDTYA